MSFLRLSFAIAALATLAASAGCKVEPLHESRAEIMRPPTTPEQAAVEDPAAADGVTPAPPSAPTPSLLDALNQIPAPGLPGQNVGAAPPTTIALPPGLWALTPLLHSQRPIIDSIDSFLTDTIAANPALAEALQPLSDPDETGIAIEDYRIIGGEVCGTKIRRGGKLYDTQGFSSIGALLLDGKVTCSGVVIGKRTVLTAAHCVVDKCASQLAFTNHTRPRSWRSNPEREAAKCPGHWFRVIGWKQLPGYESNQAYPDGDKILNRITINDIALVYLDRDFLGEPMGIPESKGEGLTLPELTYAGYGFTLPLIEPNKPRPNDFGLQTRRCVVMSPSRINDDFIINESGRRGTCNSDSGGPAISYNKKGDRIVVGVTSWTTDLCTEMFVSARVDAHASWIRDNIEPPAPGNAGPESSTEPRGRPTLAEDPCRRKR